jgi:hypothetical protein
MNRLNGWQRIFMVISVIWALTIYVMNPNSIKEVDISSLVQDSLIYGCKTGLETALKKADSTGNIVDAKALADSIRSFNPFNYYDLDVKNPCKENAVLNKYNKQELNSADTREYAPILVAGKRVYRMPDGALIDVDIYGFTESEFIAAYEKIQPLISDSNREALQSFWIDTAKLYFLPLLVMYFLGWSISWIRKGFNKI